MSGKQRKADIFPQKLNVKDYCFIGVILKYNRDPITASQCSFINFPATYFKMHYSKTK